jgi:hypothetical protein
MRDGNHDVSEDDMSKSKTTELCDEKFPDPRGPEFDVPCERPLGHSGKHDSLVTGWWSDKFAEEVREERRKKIEREPF